MNMLISSSHMMLPLSGSASIFLRARWTFTFTFATVMFMISAISRYAQLGAYGEREHFPLVWCKLFQCIENTANSSRG